MIIRRPLFDSRSTIDFFQRIPLSPFYGVAAFGLGLVVLLDPSEWRLLSAGLTAACFNIATALLTLRAWPTAVAVLGVGLTYIQQAIALVGMCIAGLLGYLHEIFTYQVMVGNEIWVLILFCTVSTATLLLLGIRYLFIGQPRLVRASHQFNAVAQDSRLEVILIAAAIFTLLFWFGGLLNFGVLRAVFLTLQRAFMFVPFLAGFYFRVSRPATSIWVFTVLANLILGIVTGSRGPAFVPIIVYCIGVLIGATARQRWLILGGLIAISIPGVYVFGMIESVRSSVGRLQISEITISKISQVSDQLKIGKEESREPYEQLPTWVRANYRLLTWPAVVVAATTGGDGPYRGYSDVPQQIMASLNVVSITGEMSSYYNEGLFNLRAADYGFRVNEGTSVEFGFLAESWDRGGPGAAMVYALIALTVFWLVEAGVRRFLAGNPALRTVAVCVVFTTAFWTLNIYNLPLSLRQIPVNLIICYVVFSVVSLVAPQTGFVGKKQIVQRRRLPERTSYSARSAPGSRPDIP